jgi:hypothetical protein
MASKIENLFASSRFVLPEHRELYLQLKEDQKLVPQPMIEQDKLESFHYLIRDSGREDYAVTVSWWKPMKDDLGTICNMWGVVKHLDSNNRRIKLVNEEDAVWIDMNKIVDIRA